MSRITHFKLQPVNVQFWDYYILCHLNAEAAICLQRMEYWDGTKEDGNTHAEDINGTLEQAGKQPTQDTSNWVYKAQDALTWELMGIVGERRMPQVVNFLVDDLKYIGRRNNPYNTWDRKKQYAFNAATVQEHINYLGYIISYFSLPMRRLCPVFYAIETLTREGKFIDKLNVKMVLEKLEEWKENAEKLPHFLKEEIVKFFSSLSKSTVRPFRNFAEWKAQKRGMHSAKTQNRKRKIAESIPQKRGSNSIEDYHRGQPIEDKHNEGTEENALSSIDETRTLSSSSNSSPSITGVASETPSQPLTDTTQPLTAEPAPSEPALPEFASQAQEKATGQDGEQSTKQAELLIVESDTGKTSSGKGNKDSKPGTTTAKKPTPGAEEKALRKQVQKWIDEKRGYKLYGSATEKQIFAEQNAVSMFALKLLNEQQGNHEEGCTWDELDHLWKETRKDTYWGKPENIGRIGGYALQQQFTTIILGKYRKTKLKQMRDQNAAQGATQTGTNMASAVQEHRQLSDLERRNAELRAKYGQKQIS